MFFIATMRLFALALLVVCLASITRRSSGAGCSGETSCVKCLLKTPAFGFGFSGEFCKFCPTPSLGDGYYSDDAVRQYPIPPGTTMEWPGACWDEAAGDDQAAPAMTCNVASTKGASGSKIGWSPMAKSGWLFTGEFKGTDEEKLALAKRICESYHPPEAVKNPTPDLPTIKESKLGVYTAEEVQTTLLSYIIQSRLADEATLMNNLRLLDIKFFSDKFDFSTLGWDVLGRSVQLGVALVAGEALNAIGEAIDFKDFAEVVGDVVEVGGMTFDALPKSKAKAIRVTPSPLVRDGGKANTNVFRDVTYNQLLQAVMKSMKRLNLTDATGLLADEEAAFATLHDETHDTLAENRSVSNAMSSTHHVLTTGVTGWIKRGLVFGGHVTGVALAPVTGGASLAINAGLAGTDFVASASLSATNIVNVETKIEALIVGLIMTEAMMWHAPSKGADSYHGPLRKVLSRWQPCDITDYTRPYHGCLAASDSKATTFCKRENLLYPPLPEQYERKLFSYHGMCVPHYKNQNPNNYPCKLHSDCESAYCAYPTIKNSKGKQVSLNGPRFRLDMPVDAEYISKDMNVEMREMMMTGLCKTAKKIATSDEINQDLISEYRKKLCPRSTHDPTAVPPAGCRKITDCHNFFECDGPLPSGFAPSRQQRQTRLTKTHSLGALGPLPANALSLSKRSTSLQQAKKG